MSYMNNGQETPYQVALREHPPLPNGTWIKFKSQFPGNTGEIVGRGAIYENNVFHHWMYTIIPVGCRQGTHILHSTQVSAENILS